MTVRWLGLDAADVLRFFEQRPRRRYFVRLLGVNPKGYVGVVVVAKGPRTGETATVINWRPGDGAREFGLERIERWLLDSPDADLWAERLLACDTHTLLPSSVIPSDTGPMITSKTAASLGPAG